MPTVINYETVLQRLTQVGWVCLYPRSGAFGLPKDSNATSIGWIGGPDPSLRPEAMQIARTVSEPVVQHLVNAFIEAWQRLLPGELWLMPKSHWAYELQFGNATWLPAALEQVGVSADMLIDRADGSAVSFSVEEVEPLRALLTALLTQLHGSDFLAAFPGRSTVCTVHSHQQLWWTTSDAVVLVGLESLIAKTGSPSSESGEV